MNAHSALDMVKDYLAERSAKGIPAIRIMKNPNCSIFMTSSLNLDDKKYHPF